MACANFLSSCISWKGDLMNVKNLSPNVTEKCPHEILEFCLNECQTTLLLLFVLVLKGNKLNYLLFKWEYDHTPHYSLSIWVYFRVLYKWTMLWS